MTATLEAPPVEAPKPRFQLSFGGTSIQVTGDDLERSRKWCKENVKACPVIPPYLAGDPDAKLFFPPKPEKLLFWTSTGKEKAAEEVVNSWNKAVTLMEQDPLRYGHRPSCWSDADKCISESLLTCIFGGGGSSKTRFAAELGVRTMLKKPGAKVLWLHEAQQPSIDIQQAYVYDMLPPEWKRLKYRKSDRITKINWTKAGGFMAGAHHKFVLPNGSMGLFGFYNQDIKVCEGYGWDLVLADEDLPLGWLKTLLYRLPRQNGKMVWTFTPIRGITPAIKEVVDGATVIETRKAELLDQHRVHVPGCPKGHMPYLQKGIFCDGGSQIIYFFTEMNPWSGYEQQKKVAARATTEEKERRFYGWSRQLVGKRFPKFGGWNIVKEIPKDVTRYVVMDPGPGRNAFIIWVAVDRYRRHWIYREWPDVETYGEWAVTSETKNKWDGDMGPAQKPLGKGVKGYKEIMLNAEGNTWTGTHWQTGPTTETIFIRYGDPRAMADPSGVEEGQEGSNMFSRFVEEQKDEKGNVIGPSMDFLPAPGYHIERGVEMINDLLDKYNPDEPPTAMLNEPGLFVHERCKNVIWAMNNWTGIDGEKGASKDPVDTVRYMATADLQFHDPKMQVSYGGGSY